MTSATALAAGAVDVVAGTAWLFARPEIDGTFDVLFVDEAGQMSLANAVAIGRALGPSSCWATRTSFRMVSQGVHPGGVGSSSLEHLSGTRRPSPGTAACSCETSGGCTRRQRVHLRRRSTRVGCEHVSGAPSRRIDGNDAVLSGAGIRWLPTPHDW